MRSSFKFGAAIGILTVISATAGGYFCPRPARYNECFEDGFRGCTVDADVPPDPNNPCSNVDWKG